MDTISHNLFYCLTDQCVAKLGINIVFKWVCDYNLLIEDLYEVSLLSQFVAGLPNLQVLYT